MKSGLDPMPLFLLDDLLINYLGLQSSFGTSSVVGPSETAIFSPHTSSFLPSGMDLATFFLVFPFLLLMGLISRYTFSGIFLAFSSGFISDSMDFSPSLPSVVSILSSEKSRFLMGLQSIFGTSSVV